MKHTKQAGVELVVLSPQSADKAQKQATADKLKFNLLVDASNEVAEGLQRRLHFARGRATRIAQWHGRGRACHDGN